MLMFGHPGITLGAAVLLAGALGSRNRPQDASTQAGRSGQRPAASATQHSAGGGASWLTSLGSRLDIRLLLVGSLLPDIIDKPVGQFFFRDTFSQGRIFSHTLLFLVLITAVALWLYLRHKRTWLLALSLGTFAHLILDQMWMAPQTLLWPFYGVAFGRIELADWIPNMFQELLSSPGVYVPELAGLAVLVWFGLVLSRRRKVRAFIRYGQV